MAKSYIGKAPLTMVRTDAGGYAYVYGGAPVPGDISDEDLKRLVDEGFLEEDTAAPAADPADDGKPTSVKDILKDVGDDKAKAQEYLDEETAKGDDARSSLVEKLTAIVQG